jgi:hypothetical protein
MSYQDRTERPTEADYLEATLEVVEDLDEANTSEYLATWRRHTSTRFLDDLSDISAMVPPVDRTLGIIEAAEMKTVKRAIGAGGLMGLLISKKAFEPFVVNGANLFKGFSIPGVDPDAEPLDIFEGVATSIRELGWRGLRLMGDAPVDALEQIEGFIVPDIRHQQLVRIGAGLIVGIADAKFEKHLEVERQAELAKFQKDIEDAHEIDWDVGMIDLLKGESS